MPDSITSPSPAPSKLPPDDPKRNLTIARPDHDQALPHLSVVGDTYTILVKGADTAGRYALIDMLIPPGGGPPPHRHDFEEMFHVLEGEIQLTFRGATSIARQGDTVNIPANAPHAFSNKSSHTARLLCMVAPAGQEAFFMEIGIPVPTRTSPPPELSESERAAQGEKAIKLAAKYRNEMLPP